MKFSLLDDKYRRVRGREWLHPDLGRSKVDLSGYGPMLELLVSVPLEEAKALQQQANDMMQVMFVPPAEEDVAAVTKTHRFAPGLEGEPDAEVYVYTPNAKTDQPRPVWFHIYGGAYHFGSPCADEANHYRHARELDCVVVATQYRQPPESPYPAAIDDLHAVFNWLVDNADELGIDPDRMAVEGASAGGGLAASLCHRLKDAGGGQFAGQVLRFPTLDDRQGTDASNIFFANVWLPTSDQAMWRSYLGIDKLARCDVPPEAAAGHARDLSGLPPAYIHAGEHDQMHDDCINYARGLLKEGIFCDLHLWGGVYHAGFDMQPDTPISREYLQEVERDMVRCMSGELVRKFL